MTDAGKFIYHTLNGVVISDKELTRKFGGKIKGFKDKHEANFEKAHLKAYLKGHKYFNHGFLTNINGVRERVVFETQEIWA